MFDSKKFKKNKFTVRTVPVPVPDLKQFFDKKEKPVWVVRGLTGNEVGTSKEAAAKNKSMAGIIAMLESAGVSEKTAAMEAVLDLGAGRISDNTAERLEQLTVASVKPECDLDLALLICERYPVDFYNITNEILRLTGLGMMPGKPGGSGKKQT